MIGYLRGILLSLDPPQLVVDVGGVGYEIEAPASTWAELPKLGAEVRLHTHLVIRDDQHLLYGFAREAERALFRNLIKVSGVGARTALGILSGSSVEDFVRCVQLRDTAGLMRLPGVGRKTAERLILDLGDKLEAMLPDSSDAVVPPSKAGPGAEALGALQALGYKPQEARRLLEQAVSEGAGTTAEILRAALRAAIPAKGS